MEEKKDLEAYALYIMARKHWKKMNEYAKALIEHWELSGDDDFIVWDWVLDDKETEQSFKEMEQLVKDREQS